MTGRKWFSKKLWSQICANKQTKCKPSGGLKVSVSKGKFGGTAGNIADV